MTLMDKIALRLKKEGLRLERGRPKISVLLPASSRTSLVMSDGCGEHGRVEERSSSQGP